MTELSVFPDCVDNQFLFEDEDIYATGFAGRAGDCLEIESGTTFVAVSAGALSVNGYVVGPGMYACVPAPAVFSARFGTTPCRALLAIVKRYKGIFMLGGPLEESGRLRYISGCTDTGLIQPLRLGDPCLNYLHFPASTMQDAHHHPSHRIGLVHGGAGLCHHADKVSPLLPGSIFVLPAGVTHWFETADKAMRIVAFHPDSEFGPTDESHQMLNATLSAA